MADRENSTRERTWLYHTRKQQASRALTAHVRLRLLVSRVLGTSSGTSPTKCIDASEAGAGPPTAASRFVSSVPSQPSSSLKSEPPSEVAAGVLTTEEVTMWPAHAERAIGYDLQARTGGLELALNSESWDW